MNTLQSLSDSELLSKTESLVSRERELEAEILQCFREIERRRLYLERGYASLYDMARKHFRYSEGAATLRISAMRAIRDLPEPERTTEALRQGEVNLSTLSAMQGFLREERKNGREYSPEEKNDLVGKITGMSRRECETLFATISPQASIPRERERVLTETQTEVRFVASRELLEKLDRARGLLSHGTEGLGTYAELLEKMAEFVIRRKDPRERRERRGQQGEQAATRRGVQPGAKLRSMPAGDAQAAGAPATERSQPAPALPQSATAAVAQRDAELQGHCPAPHPRPESHPRPAPQRRKPIPAALARRVWQRDQGCCAYVDPLTGRRCQSRFRLEIDHVLPLAHGGTNELENLRLKCRGHNTLVAIQQLGKSVMRRYLRD